MAAGNPAGTLLITRSVRALAAILSYPRQADFPADAATRIAQTLRNTLL
jgi:hypothetical protein